MIAKDFKKKIQVEFDAKNHSYMIDGKELPSVTQIIPKPDYSMIPLEVLENARNEGIQDHFRIQVFNQNLMQNPRYKYNGNNKAIIEYSRLADILMSKGYRILLCEEPLGCKSKTPRMSFCGTPDIVFYKDEKFIVGDLKRTISSEKILALQLCGYEFLIEKNFGLKGEIKEHFGFTLKEGLVVRKPCDRLARSYFLDCVQKFYIKKEINQWMN